MKKISYRTDADGLQSPNITMNGKARSLSKYGLMRWNFLKEHQPELFDELLTQGTLHEHCEMIEKQAREMKDTIVKNLRAKSPPPQEQGFLAMAGYNTMIDDQAEQAVRRDLILNPTP